MANLLSFMLERIKVDYNFLPTRQAVHLLSIRALLYLFLPPYFSPSLSLFPPLSLDPPPPLLIPSLVLSLT